MVILLIPKKGKSDSTSKAFAYVLNLIISGILLSNCNTPNSRLQNVIIQRKIPLGK